VEVPVLPSHLSAHQYHWDPAHYLNAGILEVQLQYHAPIRLCYLQGEAVPEMMQSLLMLPDGQSDNGELVAAALQQEVSLFRQALFLKPRLTPCLTARLMFQPLAGLFFL